MHQRLEYLAPQTFFRGGGTNLITRTNSFRVGGTQADCLLDDYVRWRAAGPEPLSLRELDGCVRYLHGVLGADADEDAEQGLLLFRGRLNPNAARRARYTSPARGGQPDLESLDHDEALSRGLAAQTAGQQERAQQLLRRALELRPDSERALRALDRAGQ